MSEDKPLINRVAQSSLITINLEDYFPDAPILAFDLKDFLFQGLILREKEFRAALKEYNWSSLKDTNLAIFCSNDAIIPTWAFMLVTTLARPFVKQIYLGTPDNFLEKHYSKILSQQDFSHLEGSRVVIKGCSNKPVPASAYVDLASILQPFVQSMMYGEPCSTVPIFKRPRNLAAKS